MQLSFVDRSLETPAILKSASTRERQSEYGPETLIDAEIISIIMDCPTPTAEKVLELGQDLKALGTLTESRLLGIKGITQKKASQFISAIEFAKRLARSHGEREKITSPSDVADLLMSRLRYLQKEIVVVLTLDTKGGVTQTGTTGHIDELTWGKAFRLKGEHDVFSGTLNACVFHPREIFRFAIEEAANSIILVHNHPSGDPKPSQEDIRATKQLIEAGNTIGIKVLDHIVIGDGIFVSLKEENFI